MDCKNLFSKPISLNEDLNDKETVMPNIVLPGLVESLTAGEILPRVRKERNTKLRVYTKKKNHQKCREPTVS